MSLYLIISAVIPTYAEDNKQIAVVDQNSQYIEYEKLTQNILEKELELESLNTFFQLETTLVSPWRQRRVFLYGETTASCTEAGILIALPVRYQLAKQKMPSGTIIPPQDIDADEELPEIVNGQVVNTSQRNKNRQKLTAAARTQLVGQSVGIGGDIFELTLNFIHYCKLKKQGINPSAYEKKVHILHNELDNLINQRQALLANIKNISPAEWRVIQCEGNLLNDLRDLRLIEYSKFHSATKRFWAFQNTAFLVDMAKNGTGATANIIGLISNHLQRPRMQGGIGVMNTISGAIVLLTPIVGRVTGNLSGLAAERISSKELTNLGSADLNTFALHRQQLTSALAQIEEAPYSKAVLQRNKLYELEESLATNMLNYNHKQKERGRGTLRENIAFATAVGPPRIANGITSILGGWRYYSNPPTANKVYAAGLTSYLGGNSFNMLETARVFISAELQNKKLAKQSQLPRQHFQQRLETLTEMQSILSHH